MSRTSPLRANLDALFSFCSSEFRRLFASRIEENNEKNTIKIINQLKNIHTLHFTDFTLTRLMTDHGIDALTDRETLRLLINTYIDHIMQHLFSMHQQRKSNHPIILRALEISIEKKPNILGDHYIMEITYNVNNENVV